MDSGIYRFNVGSFECIALSDGRYNYPMENIFANVPIAKVQAALQQHHLPVNQITTPYTCLLVNTNDHRVLIDTGAGNIGKNASKLFPTVDHTTTQTGLLVENMQATGIQPDDIDMIIITHAHPDHVSGILDESGELVFANARYFLHRDEFRFWTSEVAFEKTSPAFVQIARHNLEPIWSQLTLIDDEAEILPGIRAIPTPGHTPGHTVVSINSSGEELLNISDVALHPLHLEHPDWVPALDINPLQAVMSKHQILNQAAAERILLFAHHFAPFPNLGYVIQQGEAWQWRPLATA